VRERPDDCPDELVPEAEAPDQPPEDAHLPASSASDASDDVRPDAVDAADLRRAPLDAGAEKLAVLAPDARAQDASFQRQAHLLVQLARPVVAAEPCTPDAAPSVEQSCAVPVASAVPKLPEAPDVEELQ